MPEQRPPGRARQRGDGTAGNDGRMLRIGEVDRGHGSQFAAGEDGDGAVGGNGPLGGRKPFDLHDLFRNLIGRGRIEQDNSFLRRRREEETSVQRGGRGVLRGKKTLVMVLDLGNFSPQIEPEDAARVTVHRQEAAEFPVRSGVGVEDPPDLLLEHSPDFFRVGDIFDEERHSPRGADEKPRIGYGAQIEAGGRIPAELLQFPFGGDPVDCQAVHAFGRIDPAVPDRDVVTAGQREVVLRNQSLFRDAPGPQPLMGAGGVEGVLLQKQAADLPVDVDALKSGKLLRGAFRFAGNRLRLELRRFRVRPGGGVQAVQTCDVEHAFPDCQTADRIRFFPAVGEFPLREDLRSGRVGDIHQIDAVDGVRHVSGLPRDRHGPGVKKRSR